MGKAYVFLAEDFEVTEALTTIDILRRAEIDTISVSLTGERTVTGAPAVPVLADALFCDVRVEDIDIIILPGGPGTEHYYAYPALLELVTAHAKAGNLIAAICAAPAVFARLGLLSGKAAVCYPAAHLQQILRENGAVLSENMVKHDGSIITGKGPGTTPFFALEIVRAMVGDDTAESVKQAFLLDFV